MEKKRLLYVTQELDPFTEGSELATILSKLPKYLNANGFEVRILMPRYGAVNERRHRLHEVVRLSGMNIIVDDDDFPLIIKVTSMPESRQQVYFLDNEEFFKRQNLLFANENGEGFEDNPERSAFFCKGVIEIIKKFGWPPDIILCQGWLTGLLPLYLRTLYKNEPLFSKAQIVYAYDNTGFEKQNATRYVQKAMTSLLKPSDLDVFMNGEGVSVHKGASFYADGVITGNANWGLHPDTIGDKPHANWENEEEALDTYLNFFRGITAQTEVSQ